MHLYFCFLFSRGHRKQGCVGLDSALAWQRTHNFGTLWWPYQHSWVIFFCDRGVLSRVQISDHFMSEPSQKNTALSNLNREGSQQKDSLGKISKHRFFFLLHPSSFYYFSCTRRDACYKFRYSLAIMFSLRLSAFL